MDLDAIRVIFANTGALVREKFFQKRKAISASPDRLHAETVQPDTASETSIPTDESFSSELSLKKSAHMGIFATLFKKKVSKKSMEADILEAFGPEGQHVRSVSEGAASQSALERQEQLEREQRLHEKARLLFGKYYPQ